MQISLNEQEITQAITDYLGNSVMDLKGKTVSVEFDGECLIDVESDGEAKPVVKATRKRRTRKPEPVAVKAVEEVEEESEPVVETKEKEEDEVTVEDVVDTLGQQLGDLREPEDDLFPAQETPKKTGNSIFA